MSIIPQSLDVQVLTVSEISLIQAFSTWDRKRTNGSAQPRLYLIFIVYLPFVLHFSSSTLQISMEKSKTDKQFDLFELFLCGPEVTEDKTKLVKHIFNQMSIIHESFVL